MKNNSMVNTTLALGTSWIHLAHSSLFLLKSKRLLGWSFLLVLVTALFTWFGYSLAIEFVDGLTGSFFLQPPDSSGVLGWFKHKGWVIVKYAFYFVSRVVGFYLAFMAAYCLTAPGYVFLSASTEKLLAGDQFEQDAPLTVGGVIIDLFEGVKIGALGLVVTVVALAANLIPVIGQIVVFLLYTYYSALMFVDYPTSRRRWTLAEKIGWVKKHRLVSFRLGVFPALLSLIPLVNIFFLALVFPLLTVHTTLNFTVIEHGKVHK